MAIKRPPEDKALGPLAPMGARETVEMIHHPETDDFEEAWEAPCDLALTEDGKVVPDIDHRSRWTFARAGRLLGEEQLAVWEACGRRIEPWEDPPPPPINPLTGEAFPCQGDDAYNKRYCPKWWALQQDIREAKAALQIKHFGTTLPPFQAPARVTLDEATSGQGKGKRSRSEPIAGRMPIPQTQNRRGG